MLYEIQEKDKIIRWATDNNDDPEDVDDYIIADSEDEIEGILINYIVKNNERIEIPAGVEEILYGAFVLYMSKPYEYEWVDAPVKEIVIPSSVQFIKNGAFLGLSLNNVIIDEECPAAIFENRAIFSKDKKRL